MAMEVVDLKCPGCGAPIDTTQADCKYCGRPIVVRTLNTFNTMDRETANKYQTVYKGILKEEPNNAEVNASMGMYLLNIGSYGKALEKFEKAIEDEVDNSEAFFWAGVSMLNGKRPFITPKATIEKAIEYATSASMIENRGIYNYFISYLKYDFYFQKMLKISPDYQEELQTAIMNNVTLEDINILSQVMKVQFPEELAIN